MNKIIQSKIEQVSNSFPSLYSKDDVVKLLTDLSSQLENETPQSPIDNELLLTVFKDMLCNKDWESAVDKDEIDFSIGWDKKIEIDNCPINEDFIIEEATNALEAALEAISNLEN
jgi:hypothetical protein